MKIAIVERSKKGSLYLSPSNFGDKIEFISRKSGEFREGEIVVALECVHDTQPTSSDRGTRFVRVRRPSDSDIAELEKLGWTIAATVAVEARHGVLVVEDVTYLSPPFPARHSLELRRRRREVEAACLDLEVEIWLNSRGGSSIGLWEGSRDSSRRMRVLRGLAREILEKVFGFDVEAEAAAHANAKAEAAANAKAKAEAEEQRRIELFFTQAISNETHQTRSSLVSRTAQSVRSLRAGEPSAALYVRGVFSCPPTPRGRGEEEREEKVIRRQPLASRSCLGSLPGGRFDDRGSIGSGAGRRCRTGREDR